MNFFNFVIFFISFTMTSAQEEDFSEKNNPLIFRTYETLSESENSSAPKAAEKTFQIPTQQHLSATPNRTPPPQTQFPACHPAPNPTRTIHLSDNTGQYDLRLQNFRQGRPSDFQAALGAISAHILNQKTNQEYIPYPPNENSDRYYHQRPFRAEPPATGAYERGSRSDYEVSTDVDHRAVSLGEYAPGIPSESFYGSYFDQKASRPFFGY